MPYSTAITFAEYDTSSCTSADEASRIVSFSVFSLATASSRYVAMRAVELSSAYTVLTSLATNLSPLSGSTNVLKSSNAKKPAESTKL